MIPQQFIDDIIAAANIVDIINARISLRKQGSGFVALCPFHDEKTPSFNVIPDKHFYYCHGCGAHGNAIGFLMQYDRMEFVEAVKYLASDLGFALPEENNQQTSSYSEDFEWLEKIDCYYQECLKHQPDAIAYLKSRGLDGRTAKYFQIGFAPQGWDNLVKNFGEKALDCLKRNGLVVQKDDNRCYDRFRNRVMFPIRNTAGKVIAFGGRALGDDTPKYMNSPETPLFHKSQELYGLYEVLQKSRSPESIVLVEGYMDVIALHQYGIENAVAALGTATNPKHLQKLFRYTNEVIFCFDGDAAGQKAAWRALITNLAAMRDGIQLRFMFLPEKEDPDTLVRRIGKQGFLQRADRADPLSRVFFDLLKKEIPLDTPDAKANFANKAMSYLNRMPKGIFRELMLAELAKQINVYVSDVESSSRMNEQKRQQVKQTSWLLDPAQKAIALLLQEPKLQREPINIAQWKTIDLPSIPLLLAVVNLLETKPGISVGEIIAHFEDELMRQEIAMLAARQLPFAAEGILAEFNGAIAALEKHHKEQAINYLIEKSKRDALSADEKKRLYQLLTDKHQNRV